MFLQAKQQSIDAWLLLNMCHQVYHKVAVCCRYPYNLDFDYGALEGLQKFSINNLGDPFIESNYGVHSREFEVRAEYHNNANTAQLASSVRILIFVDLQIGVLQWFAKLWEIDSEDYWGYITNCGTEGNLHGILVGRENHPDGKEP